MAVYAVRLSERQQRRMPAADEDPAALPEGVGDVLAVLRSSGIVLDSADAVVNNSPAAVANGLVRGKDLSHPELLALARQVRRDGVIREVELELPRGPAGRPGLAVAARVAPLGSSHVLLLVEDRSEARRLEEIRRDFVANVSHELKTPVGGLALLAEAVLDAHDDPEAVTRFARRMQVESTRLSRLVQEIVDLSRLQVAASLSEPQLVDLAAAAQEAVDRSRLAAEDKDIEIALVSTENCDVWGDHELLVTAIRNLIGNAVAYSDAGTPVVVAVRAVDGDRVELAVTDQGHGIAVADQQRIFERFYRVDSARSRSTGGTDSACRSSSTSPPTTAATCRSGRSRARDRRSLLRLPAMTVGRKLDAESRQTDDTVRVARVDDVRPTAAQTQMSRTP
jgi:two-component system sensor histidine kinase SenX3